MLRSCVCLLALVSLGSTAAAQGFGGSSGFGQSTTQATLSQAGSGQGGAGQAGTASGMGSMVTPGMGFNFDPRFGTSAFSSPFGAATGLGGAPGLGGIGGLGGLGGIGGRFGGLGGGFGGFGGFGSRGGFGQNQQQNQSKIRATIKVGFDYQAPPPQVQAQAAQATLARLPIPQRFEQAAIQFNGRQAIVSGQFENEEDIAVLRQLLLLEPGVDAVDVQQAVVVVSPVEIAPPPPLLP